MRGGTAMPKSCHWLPALREPERAQAWSLAQWADVIRMGRRLRLLGRLGESLAAAGQLERLPPAVARHLRADIRLARWQTRALAWAADRASAAIGEAGYPRVLLKGAAYVADDLPIGRGRLPSDLDILVPRRHLADAQARLMAAGWREIPLDAHDRRYYHDWSHEAPPMRHPQHSLELDLHHNVLPPVARLTVDADRLLARAHATGWPGWLALDAVDQVLHAAVHLFQDPDLTDRVRDLVDLDGLCRLYARREGFWQELADRAAELGLGEPLWLALWFLQAWFDTPVPAPTWTALDRLGPGPVRRSWLLPALAAVLTPLPPDAARGPGVHAAAGALLVRHHLGRLPLRLLVPHAWHKLRFGRKAAPEQDPFAPRPMRADERADPG